MLSTILKCAGVVYCSRLMCDLIDTVFPNEDEITKKQRKILKYRRKQEKLESDIRYLKGTRHYNGKY